jgi:hypothetical protein
MYNPQGDCGPRLKRRVHERIPRSGARGTAMPWAFYFLGTGSDVGQELANAVVAARAGEADAEERGSAANEVKEEPVGAHASAAVVVCGVELAFKEADMPVVGVGRAEFAAIALPSSVSAATEAATPSGRAVMVCGKETIGEIAAAFGRSVAREGACFLGHGGAAGVIESVVGAVKGFFVV